MTDTIRELYARPILTHERFGGSVMPPLDMSRYSTRVEIIPIRDDRPLLYFDADLERDHISAIAGYGITPETIDERARRERPDIIKLLFWTGALIGCAIFWSAVAMIVSGLIGRWT